MATELAVLGQRPSYLPVAASAGSSFAADLTGGMSLPKLSFRGKAWRAKKDSEETVLTPLLAGQPMQMIVVARRPSISKAYYDKPYDPKVISPPRCYAVDGQNPRAGEGHTAPVASACAACPMNQWGSATRDGRVSKGKACSDTLRLVVYPIIGSGDARMVQAMVLDLASSSMKAKNGAPPAFAEYVRLLEQNQVDPRTYVAEVTFTDDEYPRLVFAPKRYATAEEWADVQAMQESEEVAEVLAGDATAPVAGAAPMTTVGTPPVAAAPASQPAAAPEPQVAAAPTPEPEPAPAAPAAGESPEEIVARLRAMMGQK